MCKVQRKGERQRQQRPQEQPHHQQLHNQRHAADLPLKQQRQQQQKQHEEQQEDLAPRVVSTKSLAAAVAPTRFSVTFLHCILFSLLLSFCHGLQLGAYTTKTPRVTKYTTRPPSSSSMNHDATTSIYRFNATNGITCILISVDGLISFKYRNKQNNDVEADLYLPDNPQLSGECVESNLELLTLEFKGFKLTITFKKSSGGEGWYINLFELTYSSSNALFEHPDRPGLDVKLTSPSHTPMYFPTPVGKSYVCDKEQSVVMYAPLDSGDQSGHIARLYLRELHMQSFMFKDSGKWGPPFHCSATGSYRDETAPLAVGTALAIAVLITISGYGGWRYFKIKKVQYGSME